MKYFFLAFLCILTSCISDENLNRQVNSRYKGDYFGNFNGDLTGEITFTVSPTGNLEGTVYYTNPNSSESISGYVMDVGKFDANTKSGLTYSGYLHDTFTNGKWKKGDLMGSYTFHKK